VGLLVTKGEHPHSKTFTWVLRQASKRGQKESIYLYNIPECIMALSIPLFFLKKKGEQIGVGKRERGGYEPSPVAVPGPPIPSFPFARPDEVR